MSSHVSADGSGAVVATTEREFVELIRRVLEHTSTGLLAWLRLWSGQTRQPLWVAFVRTLASSAPSCPDRAHEWCRVLGTVWRRHGDHQGIGYCHAVPRSEPDSLKRQR